MKEIHLIKKMDFLSGDSMLGLERIKLNMQERKSRENLIMFSIITGLLGESKATKMAFLEE